MWRIKRVSADRHLGCGPDAGYELFLAVASRCLERPLVWERARLGLRSAAGVAVALDLLDEVETLRHEVTSLRHQLDKLQR